MTLKNILLGFLFSILLGCAGLHGQDDPLKHSKKLIKKGHGTLYNNGAFQVPNTRLKLIPAGPAPLELATEMMGMRARQSFLTSINNAAESVYIIPAGTALSVEYASKILKTSEQIGSGITNVTRTPVKLLIDKSNKFANKMVHNSWEFGKATAKALDDYGIGLEEGSIRTGELMTGVTDSVGSAIVKGSMSTAGWLSRSGTEGAKESLLYAGNSFIKGYASIPEKFVERGTAVADALHINNFTKGITRSNKFRQEYSESFTDLMGEAVSDTAKNVGDSFRKAGEALDSGSSFGVLKSIRWVLQGILWDGIISPIVKLGTGSIGYIAVNAVAFPVMVVVEEGIAVTKLAVEVTWNTVGAVYDLVAPSAVSAVASVYSVFQFTGGNIAAGTVAVGGLAVGGAEVVAGQVVGQSVKAVGYMAGKGVQYIGVPLAAAGVTVGSGAVGVVAGSTAAVTGGAVVIAGEVASATTQAFGTVIGATTVAAGSAASVVAGTAVGAYELAKAVVVPVGYELGGGIVLGYGTIAQLSAHTVLAVADASYLVLSLEGPRWVIYAVKGNLGSGDELPTGTVLDLEAMQNSGEEFIYLPVAENEMTSVVNHTYNDLPVNSDEDEDY